MNYDLQKEPSDLVTCRSHVYGIFTFRVLLEGTLSVALVVLDAWGETASTSHTVLHRLGLHRKREASSLWKTRLYLGYT